VAIEHLVQISPSYHINFLLVSAGSSFNFLQVGDRQIGFELLPNPDARGMLEEATAKVNTLPQKSAFINYWVS
jgi:hypothetical protein